MNRWQRLALLIASTVLAVSACATATPVVDDGIPMPAAFISPIDHRAYCGWRYNPHECRWSLDHLGIEPPRRQRRV